MKKKHYAYRLVNGEEGVTDNWNDAEKKVSGVPGARFQGFSTREDAEAWLSRGAEYEVRERRQKEPRALLRKKLKPGIYFDAGTGRGMGLVEVKVTDETGKSLLHEALSPKEITKFGTYVIADREATNNFGELLGMKLALAIAEKKRAKSIFGDSKLVIEYWSKGRIKKNVFRDDVYHLAYEVAEQRRAFEERGGKIAHISGDVNPADLGFHR